MVLLKEIFSSWVVRVAGFVLFAVVFIAIFANVISPLGPDTEDINHLLASPSAAHLLGTDYLGRDNLARLLVGTRASIVGALEAVGVGFVLGVIPGVLSVFLSRAAEFVVMRVVDALLTLPAIVCAIGAVAVFGETQTVAMAAIGVLLAPRFFRTVRAATLNVANSQYVEAAQLFGATRRAVISMHVWRKVLPTIAVTITASAAGAILAVSSLAYLGVGSPPPAPTWGGMLASDMDYLSVSDWQPILPGIAIVLTVAALGIIADAIRDATREGGRTVADTAVVGTPRLAEAAIEQVA